MPSEEEAILIAIAKCVAHSVAVEGSHYLAPAGVLDWSTVVAMDMAGRTLLLETIGARAAADERSRRHFKNRSYEPPDGLESPNQATIAHLATLIGDQCLVVGWRLVLDLASLGLGVTTVWAIDLVTDPVGGAFFQDLLKLGVLATHIEDFILAKPEHPIPITMACTLFTGIKGNLRYAQFDERDVLKDAYSSVFFQKIVTHLCD